MGLAAMRSSPSWVEAAIQICRPETHAGQSGKFLTVGRRRRRVILQIADHPHGARAEAGAALGVALALREAQFEAAEQRAR